MRTDAYKRYKNCIRDIKVDLLKELESADNFVATRSSIIMCRVWSCRGIIENIRNQIHYAYFELHNITQNEYRVLEKYIDKLSDYIWSEFYDKASEQDRKLQTLKYQLEKERA